MSLDQQTERDGGLVADLCAKLDLHIGSTEKLQRSMARTLQKPPAQPVFGRSAGIAAFVTGASAVIDISQNGPDQGHFWYIRSIVVGGLNPSLAVTGRGDIYISSTDLSRIPSLAAIGLGDWRDWADMTPGVAQIAFYGRGEMCLRCSEKVFVVISNGTNGQQYVATVAYEDYEEGASKQEWGM